VKQVEDIRDNPKHRAMFHSLTNRVFEFDLEQWRKLGFWPEKYKPHAFVDGDSMLSNVSTFDMRLSVEGQKLRARQVGTVMTHSEHRGHGYASRLMEHVVEKYDADADLFFLFTSPHLIPFYNQTGFEVVEERRFLAAYSAESVGKVRLHELDLTKADSRDWLFARASNRIPISRRFGILDGPEIFMYHSLYRYPDCVFHDEVQDCVLIARVVDEVLHVYDIVSDSPVNESELLSSFAGQGVKSLEFHFTPDQLSLSVETQPFDPEDVFMVRAKDPVFHGEIRNQTTLQA
jgi:GNAT superfamily N-acetyltransferase